MPRFQPLYWTKCECLSNERISHKKIMWALYWRWRCRCILEWPLDSVSKGCGFASHQCLALLSFSKTLYPHSCSLPRWINRYPVGCEGYVVYVFACNATIGSSARNAPLGVEIVHRKCGLEIASNYQGNNSMLTYALNILAGWICAHHKCSYYCYCYCYYYYYHYYYYWYIVQNVVS